MIMINQKVAGQLECVCHVCVYELYPFTSTAFISSDGNVTMLWT